MKDVQSALTSIVSGEWTKVSATHISSGVTPPTLSVTVDITDGFGASVLDDNPSNVRLNRRLCFISVRLIGIHSELPSRHLLGDVVYGNTFTITCQAGCSISLFSLTNNIPTFKCWVRPTLLSYCCCHPPMKPCVIVAGGVCC